MTFACCCKASKRECHMQVDRITSHWNGHIMHGLGGAEQEAWDICTRQTRLYELRDRPGCSVRFVRRNMRPMNPDVALDL